MPRIRSIHPDACDSEKLSQVSDGAERTYWRLLTQSDDDGRGRDNPQLLASKLYPVDESKTADVIDAQLWELVDAGLLVRYESDGKRYYEVHDFTDWQKPRHPQPSKHPAASDCTVLPKPYVHVTAERGKPPAVVDVGDGEVLGGGGGSPAAVTPLTNFPVRSNGSTLAASIVAFAEARDVQLPPPSQLSELYSACIDLASTHLGPTHPSYKRTTQQLCGEYVTAVVGQPLSPSANQHLQRLVNEFGAHGALRGLSKAVSNGAGLDEAHAGDLRALTKYANAVCSGERRSA